MPFTDKNGKVWPDTMQQNGVNLILDPVASMASKRPKYRPDPRERQEYAYKYGFAEKPKEPPSALEGLAMTGAGALTLVGGSKLGGYLGEQFGSKATEKATETGLSEVGKATMNSGAGQGAANTTSVITAGEPYAVGTTNTGGTLMSDGSVAAADSGGSFLTTPGSESTLGSLASAAAVAKGGYDTYKSVSGGEGGKGLQAGLGQIGAGVGGYTFGPIGAVVGAGMGSTLGYGIKNRDTVKGNLALLATNPLALGVNLVGKAFGYDPLGALTHESTRFKTAQNTQKLLEASDDPVYQSYVQGMREQFKEAPKGNAYAGGQFATFDEYKKAGLQANDLTGVYGNISTFGEDWAKLDEAKRQEVTQALINANLYDSKKGDVVITDKEKAKAIFQGIVGGQQPALTNLASNAAAIQRPVANNQAFRR